LVEQAQEEEKPKRRKGSQLNSLPAGKQPPRGLK